METMKINVIALFKEAEEEDIFQMLERMENDAAATIFDQSVWRDTYEDEDENIWKEIQKLEALPAAAFTEELDMRLEYCYCMHNKLNEKVNECEENIKQEREKMEHIKALIDLYKKQ